MINGKNLPCRYFGTGDLFSSLLCGYTVLDENIESAVRKSADFVHDALKLTYENGGDAKDGIEFERLLADRFLV